MKNVKSVMFKKFTEETGGFQNLIVTGQSRKCSGIVLLRNFVLELNYLGKNKEMFKIKLFRKYARPT